MIYGNTVGGGGDGLGKTFIIEDSEGNELVGVLTDSDVVIDATPNDVRAGKVAVTQNGVITGEKEIPPYYAGEGHRVVTKGSQLIIPHWLYDYTKLQVVVCEYNISMSNSVSATKVGLLDNVYDVGSTVSLSTIAKDTANKRVDLGIKNESDGMYIVRYFMYKEMY
jgi:hypothetical protein